MKNLILKKSFIIGMFSLSISAFAQYTVPALSPRQTVNQQFSYSNISVDYGRPAVRGRKIFGGLVPYGKVWRAGANSCTKITFGQAVEFGGKTVAAGTYGLFIIPSESNWTVILNKDATQWGAFDYDEKLNIAQTVIPIQKADKQEWFSISEEPVADNSIVLIFRWDDVKAVLPIKPANAEKTGKIIQKLNDIKLIERPASAKD